MLEDYTLDKQCNTKLRDASGKFVKAKQATSTHNTPAPIITTRSSSRLSEFEVINASQPGTPFKHTPAVSPVKQTFPLTPKFAQLLETMTSELVTPFHGDKDNKNPEDFLRSFFRRMGTSTDETKKQQFPNFLQADSVANEWYEELAMDSKTTWNSIETAFRACWPRKKGAKKTNEEYEEEIRELQLKMEDMGKKEKVAGREVYKIGRASCRERV